MAKYKISSRKTSIGRFFRVIDFPGIFWTLKNQNLMAFVAIFNAILTGALLDKCHFSLKIASF